MEIPDTLIRKFISEALDEDLGDGDHSSLSCIDSNEKGKARIFAKQDGVIAGVTLAEKIFLYIDSDIHIKKVSGDGDQVKNQQDILILEGNLQALLKGERLALNCMQRMSGIASMTNYVVEQIKQFKTKVLDTRKTTPGLRWLEKWAVRIGGGHNHRFGLYDMIMLKDNHIHYGGGIRNAIQRANSYLHNSSLKLPIEIEISDFEQLEEVFEIGGVQRIMLDNMSIPAMKEAVQRINGRFETEASGNIDLQNVAMVASTGVDYISMGALTHSYKSMDISMKAID